jgi:glycosyltransferase involved in cell wall biosynthesis
MRLHKIAHLTSAHPRYDTRIFLKECLSLSRSGFHTSLVVADGKGNQVVDGVEIHDVGASNGRMDRMFRVTKQVFSKARELDVDIYHLHDPELIPIGLKLKRLGKKVIFDSHEDVAKQMLGKHYLSLPVRYFLSHAFATYEWLVCRRFDAVVAATPAIRDKFQCINVDTVDINNFPMWGELASEVAWAAKEKAVCYVGGIASIRGIRETVRALEHVTSGVRLLLGGEFSEPDVAAELKAYPSWKAVDELGFLDRDGVRKVLERSIAGLVMFLPLPNHIDAQPNKMFEYMSAGIPVISSNFPLWREIVEGNDCGLCVNPMDPEAIAAAIDFLVSNPERAKQMGENGRQAVQARYNWTVEEGKLLALYGSLAPKC